MSIFGIWGITIITSLICEISNELKIFKDIAEQGYKFNLNKTKSIQNNIIPNSNNSLLRMYIPFYNLYAVLKGKIMYEQNKEMIFEQYEKLGIIEEMTEEEKDEYSKNPTGWNAMIIASHNTETRFTEKQTIPETQQTVIYPEEGTQMVKMIINELDGQTNTITTIMSTSQEDNTMKIINLSGPVKELSKDELTKYILEHMDLIMEGKNITLKRTNQYVEVTYTKIKQKTKLERYIELRDSLTKNGYLYGEEMCEYRELQDEFAPKLKMTK